MNPFTRPKNPFPRVTVPGVDQEKVEALRAEVDYNVRQRRGFLLAMIRSGRPIYGGTVTGAEKARRRARGKRQRAARKIARTA